MKLKINKTLTKYTSLSIPTSQKVIMVRETVVLILLQKLLENINRDFKT